MREIRKELTPNDVGATGSHQAGMAVPKNPDILSFFPALDPELKNPRQAMTVRVPALGRAYSVNYIYYNGKLHGFSTRNEYRLTGLTSIFKELDAKAGMIVRLTYSGSPNELLLTLSRNEARVDTGDEGGTEEEAPGTPDLSEETNEPKRFTIKGWTITRKAGPDK